MRNNSIGIYGGSFNPFHILNVPLIIYWFMDIKKHISDNSKKIAVKNT